MEPPLILRSLQGIEEEETALPHCSASLSCLAVYVVKVMFRSCVLIDYKFSFLEIRTTLHVEKCCDASFLEVTESCSNFKSLKIFASGDILSILTAL